MFYDTGPEKVIWRMCADQTTPFEYKILLAPEVAQAITPHQRRFDEEVLTTLPLSLNDKKVEEKQAEDDVSMLSVVKHTAKHPVEHNAKQPKSALAPKSEPHLAAGDMMHWDQFQRQFFEDAVGDKKSMMDECSELFTQYKKEHPRVLLTEEKKGARQTKMPGNTNRPAGKTKNKKKRKQTKTDSGNDTDELPDIDDPDEQPYDGCSAEADR